jgi:hypothetical protein
MNSKFILLAAAVLVIIAAFLPWATIEGMTETVTGFAGRGQYGGTPGAFTIGCAVVAAGMGALGKKWSQIVGILFAGFLIFLAYVIYNKDVKCAEGMDGAIKICSKAGIGSYLTFLGGFALIVGNVLGLIKPAAPAAE